MYYLKRDKKDEESGPGSNMFYNIDKTMVLQEARIFNETPINAKRCALVLTKILYIINQNQTIGVREATECFFATTKLFQSKDNLLRRLVYLVIKDMAPLAQDVIIVTSSLTKDMTGKEDLYRGPAIRTLCAITDPTMIQAIERYMKQALVDKNYTVSSAALTSSMHLCCKSVHGVDIVKRWVNEIQEAVNSDNNMVQYQALGLLYQVRKSDKLAISKIFSKFHKGSLRSPYAYILLIRMTCQLIIDDAYNGFVNIGPFYEFLESCLRHKTESVVFEAASSIVELHSVKEIAQAIMSLGLGVGGGKKSSSVGGGVQSAISVLQLFCGSANAALRFAAVKTLNKVALYEPNLLTSCNAELESLITDSNRTVSTLAITTLLKIGSESCVDRLMKQISTYINEISDPFRITIVDAIRTLCLKYPRKHTVMLNFLSTMLRDEGGFEYKRALVNTLVAIIKYIPEAKETCLAHLCEFIEDCEHAVLAVKILHLLGQEGVKTPQPSKYIRYIYNRCILESAPVRAAAVSALSKFALYCEDLRESVLVLLLRCQSMDIDDEVRDRATYYIALIRGVGGENKLGTGTKDLYHQEDLNISPACLEQCLLSYLEHQSQDDKSNEEPFDISTVPLLDDSSATQLMDAESEFDGGPFTTSASEYARGGQSKDTDHKLTIADVQKEGEINGEAYRNVNDVGYGGDFSREAIFMEELNKIPAFATLGTLFKSCLPVKLTEAETEYTVRCIKHIFTHYVVFQFDITNTLPDQILEHVSVEMNPSDEQFTVTKRIAAKFVPPPDYVASVQDAGKTMTKEKDVKRNIAYTCIRLPQEELTVSSTFTNVMKFKVKDYDPSTHEVSEVAYDDEYTLEDLELNVCDSVKAISKHNFSVAWEELGPENELEDNFILSSVTTIPDAITKLKEFLGMAPCESSDVISDSKNLHTLYLSGVYRGNHDVLARIKIVAMTQQGSSGVTINMVVRSSDPTAAEVLISAMG